MKSINEFEKEFAENFSELFYETYKIKYLNKYDKKYLYDSLIRCRDLTIEMINNQIKKAK